MNMMEKRTSLFDNWELTQLSEPRNYQDPIDISGYDSPALIRHLKLMYRIRFAEQCLAMGRKEGIIGGPVHLGVGQEAIAAGVSSALTTSDRVFGAHRSHAHVLSQGASLQALFAEVLGRNSGLAKGMGGSMHLYDQKNGFYGSVPIVAGTVSLAVGAGLAAKLQNSTDIGVSYLGDGAVEEGTVHESLNLASSMKIPVLFVVENNLFASHMHILQRQPKVSTARFAYANDIPYEVVDGNDVVEVALAASRLVEHCRNGNGPAFLEAITYRWYGHVDWREDIDVGVNRSDTDLREWKKRDPIKRLVSSLLEATICNDEDIIGIEEAIKQDVDHAWELALSDVFPGEHTLFDRVYAKLEQRI